MVYMPLNISYYLVMMSFFSKLLSSKVNRISSKDISIGKEFMLASVCVIFPTEGEVLFDISF